MDEQKRPPPRLIDKAALALFDRLERSPLFHRLWDLTGSPDILVHMPPQRIPDGRMGYRVIGIQRHRCGGRDQ